MKSITVGGQEYVYAQDCPEDKCLWWDDVKVKCGMENCIRHKYLEDLYQPYVAPSKEERDERLQEMRKRSGLI